MLLPFGFFRTGEITVPSEGAYDAGTHLNFADVAIDDPKNPTLMGIRLKSSKTDPFRNGVDIFLGRTKNQLCPIEAMLAFLAVRGDRQGFLFTFADGSLLTKGRFVAGVRQALQKAGIDCKRYSGHSFRIGAATTTNMRGMGDATIKMLGSLVPRPPFNTAGGLVNIVQHFCRFTEFRRDNLIG